MSTFDYSGAVKTYVTQDTVHEGKRPFTCTVCDQAFKRMCHLEYHFDSVHEKKKPHQYKCSVCDYSASTNKILQKHIDKAHTGNIESDNSQKISSYCKYSQWKLTNWKTVVWALSAYLINATCPDFLAVCILLSNRL